jgi:alcohol dehydrogenase
MNTAFDFAMPGQTVLSPGAVESLAERLIERGLFRVAVLMDSGIEKSGIGGNVVSALARMGITVDAISDLPREPEVTDVDSVLARVRASKPEGVVAIGGGSVLDVGKLCAVLAAAELSVLDLLDGTPVPAHTTPTVLIPTTAGTGSEATRNAIIAIPSRNTKGAVTHRNLLPDLVILDPVLTATLPAGLTATTGADALCHAMECFLSRKANAMSDILALEAMKRIAESIRRAVSDGDDLDARTDMLFASYLAGQCITLSGTNAVHAMSYPLGISFHIPHGESNAILLPYIMEYNAPSMPEKARYAAECFGYDGTRSGDSPADYLIAELHQLIDDLDISRSLVSYGVSSGDIPSLVESAFSNRRLMDNNPVALDRQQIGGIYRRLVEKQ